ncbi:hypothetical protein D3C80_1715830 [compost metagenome]
MTELICVKFSFTSVSRRLNSSDTADAALEASFGMFRKVCLKAPSTASARFAAWYDRAVIAPRAKAEAVCTGAAKFPNCEPSCDRFLSSCRWRRSIESAVRLKLRSPRAISFSMRRKSALIASTSVSS